MSYYNNKPEDKKTQNKYKSINRIERKLSIVIILLIICIIAISFLFYDLYFNDVFAELLSKHLISEQKIPSPIIDSFGRQRDSKQYNTLDEAIQKSNKTNVLLIGLDINNKADIIILFSADTNTKYVDILSFPSFIDYDKNNPTTLMENIEEITRIPINSYIEITYTKAIKIKNSLQSLGVNIPSNLNNFNDIKIQQILIQEILDKMNSENLPIIVDAIYQSSKTNIGLAQFTKLAMTTTSITPENIAISSISGACITVNGQKTIELNNDELKKIIYEIYNVKI